jgi:hypothetical protein
MLAACTPSKIPQLYATLQDAVMALGRQEPQTHGKAQPEQNGMQDRALNVS